jgi:hypothetical protein
MVIYNYNSIHEEIKEWIKLGDCYYSVQNILSYDLPSKNLCIKMYEIIMIPVILYGSLTLN